jgi:phosphatidylglycerophosphatase A
MDNLIKILATGLGLGYMPVAPGTFGTLLGVLAFYLLRFQPHNLYLEIVLVVSVVAIVVSHQAEKVFKSKDCQKIVIDEVAGVMLCYAFMPYSLQSLVWGFILFRLFDIAKIFPANYCQDNMQGGLGVVCDDLVAGIQGGLILHFFPQIMHWASVGLSYVNRWFS